MTRKLKNLKQRRAVAEGVIEPMLVGKRDGTAIATYKRVSPGGDGRIHTQLSPVGTSTMRLASSETQLEESSTNLQNMMNKIAALDPLYRVRDIFVPDEGMVLAAVDYKQAEAVTTAAYCRDWDWLDKMLSNVDTHSEHASLVFGVPADQVEGRQRKTTKNVTYASLYGASVPTVVQTINKDEHITGIRVTQAEVQHIRGVLLRAHPLEQWWHDLGEEIIANKSSIRNCFGQRRKLYDPDLSYRIKDAASFLSQSTVAWRMNENMVEVMEKGIDIPGECELLLQIHDELLFQCKPEHLPQLWFDLSTIMTRPFYIHGRELHIPVEWKVGENWGTGMEEWDGQAYT